MSSRRKKLLHPAPVGLLLWLLAQGADAAPDRGYYAGVGVDFLTMGISGSSATSVYDHDVAGRLYAGMNLYRMLDLEVALTGPSAFGADYLISGGALRFDESHRLDFGSAAQLCGIARSQLIDRLQAYIKAGVASWSAEIEMNGYMSDAGVAAGVYGASGSGSGVSAILGLGIAFLATERWLLQLGYEVENDVGRGVILSHSDGSSSEFAGKNISAISFSAKYQF